MGAWIIVVGLMFMQGVQEKAAPKTAETAPPPYVERNQKQFSFYPGSKVVIAANVPGNIRIIGWQRASVMLESEKIVFNLPLEKAKALSDQFPIRLRWNQTSATIATNGPPQSAAAMEVNLTLYIPKVKTDVNIKMFQGDLAMGAINGWVEATLGEGSIEAKSMSGYFSAITQRGDIFVEMAGKRWEGHSFTAATRQGSVELRLPEEYSAALQLNTGDGEVSIDFPAQLVEGEEIPLQATARKSARSLKATVGTGGSPIILKTSAGAVRLLKKETP